MNASASRFDIRGVATGVHSALASESVCLGLLIYGSRRGTAHSPCIRLYRKLPILHAVVIVPPSRGINGGACGSHINTMIPAIALYPNQGNRTKRVRRVSNGFHA